MVMEIIPAIIAKNIDEISQKISQVAPYVNWVQIDVADGIFSPNITWNNPAELQNISPNTSLEVHLMITNPQNFIDEWINSGAKRIIVHMDENTLVENAEQMAKAVKGKGISFGIALNPAVAPESVKNSIPIADVVLLLAVSPGYSGQKFDESILEKIGYLKENFSNVIIEIDGGINLETAKKCINAGADMLVSGSYIFESENIPQAIENLKSIS